MSMSGSVWVRAGARGRPCFFRTYDEGAHHLRHEFRLSAAGAGCKRPLEVCSEWTPVVAGVITSGLEDNAKKAAEQWDLSGTDRCSLAFGQDPAEAIVVFQHFLFHNLGC